MGKYKHIFINFIVTTFLFCLIQNIAFASKNIDYGDINNFFKQIENLALSGQEDEALSFLNTAIDTEAETFQQNGMNAKEILLLKLLAFKMRGLIRLYNQGFYNEAIKDFTTALTLDGLIESSQNPLAPIFLGYRAFAFFQAGNFSKAIEDITYCMDTFEEYNNMPGAVPVVLSNLYRDRALYHSANIENKKAVEDFRKAIELGDLSYMTFWGYAYELDIGKNYDSSAFFFQKALSSQDESDIEYLNKPIALKSKDFISKRIIAASKYVQIPEELMTKALIFSKAYDTEPTDKQLVGQIQKLLKTIGYNPGYVDGLSGKQTISAIREFQKDFKIPVDGQPTEELYNRLKITLTTIENQTKLSSNIDLSVPKLIKFVMPALVFIKIYDEKNVYTQFGSGFFVSKSSIITNFHVIDGAHRIEIKTSDGTLCHVIKTRKDKLNDLALLFLDKNYPEKRILKLSKALPEIGQDIITIGNPQGMEQSVSDGIVSAVRVFKGGSVLIQISAPISQGSSGGPVLNLNGEVIGVSTLIMKGGQNLNFAVSSKHIDELLKKQAY
jgi:tetratricopeptide (TPR) repeat protein